MSDAEILGPNDPGPRDARDANYAGGDSGRTGGGGGNGAASANLFPWERLAFTLLYAFIAWFVFWLTLILALAAGGMRLFGIKSQEDVAKYSSKAAEYLGSVLAYVSGARDNKPFPFN